MVKNRCLLALSILLLISALSACAAGSAPPAPETPSAEVTPSVSPSAEAPPDAALTPPQDDEVGDDPYAAYGELVDKVSRGLRDGWAETSPEELGIGDIFNRPEGRTLGWLRRDINGDGTDELLFGETLEGEGCSRIYDLFTLLSGGMIHPITGWEYNHWYLLEDGLLVNKSSVNGVNVDYRAVFGLFNGTLIPANRVANRSEFLTLPFQPFTEA